MEELPTLQELQSFITYSKMGNFTLAAQAANITQSAFSAQMKKLERLVGVKLIARSTRGSRLTPEGEKFLPEAEHIIETLERAIHSIRLANKLERPMLNVGILRSIGDVRMNSHVAHFQQVNPNFAISVYDMEEEEMLLDLRENRIDIGTCYLPNNKDMSAYESIALREDSVVYYAPKRDIEKHPITCEEILEYPLVMYPPKYFMSHRLGSYFSEEGRQSLHQLVRLSNPYAMIDYCKRNEAGALISRHLLDTLEITEGVYSLAKPLNLQVCFVYRNNNSKWETMKTFMDYIAQQLNQG
ncbi:LysR family transcriptional regulator [uncultured Veillonella sp.]|uniref:LysR family transcriptional regulator n=1 Tax=uncultured Veillonella sp. TaxID=159268 RepID=UPI0025EDCFA1|nr:LysR family transcriptional regulator [uncultured Veillonella sp.]MDY3974027.1 LysR family transcriptional regulator [Veillonella caviae]